MFRQIAAVKYCLHYGKKPFTVSLEHLLSLGRELDAARRDARSKLSGWDLALEDARKTAGLWFSAENCNLRQRVRSRERQVDELVGEGRKECRRLKQEHAAGKVTETEMLEMMDSLRGRLSEVRERVVADEEALEAATHDGQVLRDILEEVPSILCEVSSNLEAVTEEMKACRERLEALGKEEDVDDQYRKLENRRSKVAVRMEGLQAEKRVSIHCHSGDILVGTKAR
ncbi:hypothetical protein Pmar_PMAR024140 [Perkinsus marinus ATCC 50983]|uniref:Uncharacterized protein n=1 Tax=Perkinsus marinus (strain ATCC 50983 / TXsc) TaxID=423536 RepID=C5L2A4_PERM5|nr:hypothetical protein Pmar_PMAR024140 [Perkinsus marinus ATCC 50983]EER09116.1 hypothetical protein Pmar_PMAR024140 [Perkinsus marinus ATCC 50983]|eukprot:XP_002777300.1 hypothetical protein Pmar_PMAR024140 [Perkinsus marinus ATCC 50983]